MVGTKDHLLRKIDAEAGYLSPYVVFIDGTHIKAKANNKKISEEVSAASKRYAKGLMEEVNADREEHGKSLLTMMRMITMITTSLPSPQSSTRIHQRRS